MRVKIDYNDKMFWAVNQAVSTWWANNNKKDNPNWDEYVTQLKKCYKAFQNASNKQP